MISENLQNDKLKDTQYNYDIYLERLNDFIRKEAGSRYDKILMDIFKFDNFELTEFKRSLLYTNVQSINLKSIEELTRDFDDKIEMLIRYVDEHNIDNATLINKERLIKIFKKNNPKEYNKALSKINSEGLPLWIELSNLSKDLKLKSGIYFDKSTLCVVEVLPDYLEYDYIRSEQVMVLFHSLKLKNMPKFTVTAIESEDYKDFYMEPRYNSLKEKYHNSNSYEKIERALIPKILLSKWEYLGEL